jgi:glucose-6-phosphate 1-dehydrogenase
MFYKTTFQREPPEAYERLIFDAMTGDQTLFIRGDEAERAGRSSIRSSRAGSNRRRRWPSTRREAGAPSPRWT